MSAPALSQIASPALMAALEQLLVELRSRDAGLVAAGVLPPLNVTRPSLTLIQGGVSTDS